MPSFKLPLFLLLVFAGMVLPLHAQIDAVYAKRMQAVMDSVCAKLHLKGASVAVLVPNAGVWKGTYGLANAAGDKVKEDMYFGIGSITKTYTAALVLKLQEKGLLKLDDPISRWIKPHKNINPDITVRQLLNHTSGVFSLTEHPDFRDSLLSDLKRVWQTEELLAFIKKPSHDPGKAFKYSNTNYLLAGLIIKAVTNKPYEAALREYILEPNGLQSTFVFPQETANGTMVNPWSVSLGSPVLFDLTKIGYSNRAFFSIAGSAGGIMATAEDNAKFWHRLSSGKMLNDASWKEMCGWYPAGKGGAYGLGVIRYPGINDRVCFSHNGAMIGYKSESIVDSASGICISALTNQDSVNNPEILRHLVGGLHKVTIDMTTTPKKDLGGIEFQVDFYQGPSLPSVTVALPANSLPVVLTLYHSSGSKVLTQTINDRSRRVDVSQLVEAIYTARFTGRDGKQITEKKLKLGR